MISEKYKLLGIALLAVIVAFLIVLVFIPLVMINVQQF